MSVQPRCSSCVSMRHGDAKRRKDHHIVPGQLLDRLAGVAQEADSHRPQLIVDVRVVDDFAGQIHGPIGKPAARLIGVIDRPIDAVAEPELPGQADGQPA